MISLSPHPDRLRSVLTFQPGGEPLDAVVAAASGCLDEAFAAGVRQILWRAQVGDERSRRVAWACGFTFEGSLRADWRVGSELSDSWVATLLSDDSREPKTRWLEPVVMAAPGVILRDESADDERRYLETMQDPESLQWLGTLSLPRTVEAFRSRFARRHDGPSMGTSVAWTVADPETDRYLASINVFGIGGIDHLSAEVGYRTHPDARGHGVLTSALRQVVAHAFMPVEDGGLGLERVSLGAGAPNLASQGVARSCGFVETGRDRQCYDLYDGTVVDLIRFDLLRSDVSGES